MKPRNIIPSNISCLKVVHNQLLQHVLLLLLYSPVQHWHYMYSAYKSGQSFDCRTASKLLCLFIACGQIEAYFLVSFLLYKRTCSACTCRCSFLKKFLNKVLRPTLQ